MDNKEVVQHIQNQAQIPSRLKKVGAIDRYDVDYTSKIVVMDVRWVEKAVLAA